MNKTEDERQCSDQCYTSKAPWEGQAPSLARASWLLSTIDCLNYFGSFLGRGQGLLGSALGACFCLFLNAFSLKAESTWLSCIYQWGLKCAAVKCLSWNLTAQKGGGRNIPVQPSASLFLLASSPHWQGHLYWSVMLRLESSWIYGPQYQKIGFFTILALLKNVVHTAVSCCFHVKSNKLLIYFQDEISISFTSVILCFF